MKTAASTILWCNTFNYDRYGNLTGKVLTCGMGDNLTIPADPATNRVVGYSYDAAGNQLNDGLGHTYTYNAENKVTASGSTTFTYDGDGVRVKKSGWRMYWTGMGTEVLAESDLSGVMQKEYIYFAGRRVGFRSVPTDTIYYYFSDHLGSANVITNGSGSSIQAESDFFPFGGERVITNLINNRYKFTGKEQDTSSEGGLTHFLFREYTTNLGRFMSPDLLAGNISDPQSLNRYAYVLNNPANLVDPFGLEDNERPSREERFMAHIDRIDARLMAASGGGGSCYMNGFATSCATVFRFASIGNGGSTFLFTGSVRTTTDWVSGSVLIDQTHGSTFEFPRTTTTFVITGIAGWDQVGQVFAQMRARHQAQVGKATAPANYMDIFNDPVFAQAKTVVDAAAVGTGLVVGGVYVIAAAPAALPYIQQAFVRASGAIISNPTYVNAAADFISGWTPTAAIPATPAGAAGLAGSKLYEWWKER